MSKTIGLDLGTSTSCVSIMEGNNVVVISNSEGKKTTPSIVGFDTKTGERKVGEAAKRQAVVNPKNTVSSIKRMMGGKYSQLKKEIERASYEVVCGDNDNPLVKIEDRLYTPQEISAMIVQKMKKTAEDYLGQEVTDVVVTVPARFDDQQRMATKEACEIAGLNVKRIINEPTAAALSFGLNKLDKDLKISVFDIGGKHCTASALAA